MHNPDSNNTKSNDCGTCTDFQDWLNVNKQKAKDKFENLKSDYSKNESDSYYKECPLFRNQLGKASWSFLHTMAAYYPTNPTDTEKTKMKDFIDTFAHFFPCKHCASDFQDEIKQNPPRVDNNVDLSKWFCEQHNVVNRKLGKEEFDCDRVFERWKLGESKNPKCRGSL